MSKPEEEPKLIIDEDWKTQVQREKEELKHRLEAEAAQASSQESSSSPVQSQIAGDGVDGNTAVGNSVNKSKPAGQAKATSLPPASFTLLVTTLATQAMAAMGLMPSTEDEAAPPVNLDFAKHFIDMLSVLQDKTQGNLVDAEQTFLRETLHQLRMAFVAVSKQSSSK